VSHLHSALVIRTSRIRSRRHEGDNPEYFVVLFGHDWRPCYQNDSRLYSPILDKHFREHLPIPTGVSHLYYQAKTLHGVATLTRLPWKTIFRIVHSVYCKWLTKPYSTNQCTVPLLCISLPISSIDVSSLILAVKQKHVGAKRSEIHNSGTVNLLVLYEFVNLKICVTSLAFTARQWVAITGCLFT
jgi:hypothetical protein